MNKKINVLDHGFVRLVDYMGDDHAIAQAARVSYQKHDKEKAKNDRSLIRYLMRHRHTSPFEMVEFKFHCKMPMFVARQWIRHRTASVNEVSGRYSELPSEFYLPEKDRLSTQSKTNKQGSGNKMLPLQADRIRDRMHKRQFDLSLDYQNFLSQDLAKELARINLPLATYTEWYWKIDLHNLLHFMGLRLDAHAQWEIRQYAEAMYNLMLPVVPITCEAFEDYVLGAETFSRQEMAMLRDLVNRGVNDLPFDITETKTAEILSKRELEEFKKKLGL